MDVIKEWMAVAAAIVGAVVWLVRLEGRINKSEEGVNRVEARLTRFEATHHEQALQLARIEEAQSSIKITLDRIYVQVSERGAVQHFTDKTIPPGRVR